MKISLQRFLAKAIAFVTVAGLGACATTDESAVAYESSAPRSRHRSRVIVKDPATILAVKRTVRRISMFYRLDLKKDNSLSPRVAGIMRQHDHKIRACYTNRLDTRHSLRGDLALGIQMSKATGTIKRVVRLGGSLDDAPLLRCISHELTRLPIRLPRSVQGTLVYSFGVVREGISRRPAGDALRELPSHIVRVRQ